jgi:hypothetical protein
MDQVTGTIDSIYTKMVTIKRGPKAGNDVPVYHAIVNGNDVNLGFKCEFEEGESVNWEVEHKYGEYKYVGVGTGSGQASNQVRSGASNGAAASPTLPTKADFPVAKDSRGMTIARQNSGGHAAAMVVALIKEGHVANREEAMDAFFDMVYQITDFATGHREEAQAAALSAMEE